MNAYQVSVERRGVSPLKLKLLVRAASEDAAGGLASALAEQERGGIFTPARVRRVRGRRLDSLAFDAAA